MMNVKKIATRHAEVRLLDNLIAARRLIRLRGRIEKIDRPWQ
jgi:hypothetical protein